MNSFGFQHELINELNQMIAIISKIIISAKKNHLAQNFPIVI